MNIDAVREVLRHTTYKPNTRLEVWQDCSPDGLTVVLHMNNVPDPYQGNTAGTFVHFRRIPMMMLEHFTPDDFTRWLFQVLIMGAEQHEAQEFFKIDGEMLTDPHADDDKVFA